MGIREKLHLFKNKDNAEENSSKEAARKCVLKVQDKFRLRNTDDIVVVGELKGKIQVGDAVYMSNFSDDDGEILVTVVLGIEVGQGNRNLPGRIETGAGRNVSDKMRNNGIFKNHNSCRST